MIVLVRPGLEREEGKWGIPFECGEKEREEDEEEKLPPSQLAHISLSFTYSPTSFMHAADQTTTTTTTTKGNPSLT